MKNFLRVCLIMACTPLCAQQGLLAAGEIVEYRGASRATEKAGKEKTAGEEATEAELRKFRRALEVLSRSTSAGEMSRSLRVLSEGFPRSRPLLVEAAWRGSARVRAFALRVLGEKGEAEKDLAVVARALHDTQASVRLVALRAIRSLGTEGFQAIKAYLPNEPEPRIRRMAIQTIRLWKDPDAIPFLVSLLRKEKKTAVRRILITALEELSNRRFGDDLASWEDYAEEYLYRQQDELILRYARSALNKRKE